MNRSELVETVKEKTGLEARHAEEAVKAVVETVIDQIKSGNKVSIFGFGTFAPTSRAARVGRNPQTGDAVNIPARTGVRFSPATAVKASLNPKPAAKKSGTKKAAAASAPAKKATASAAAAKAAPAKGAPAKKETAAKKAAAPEKKAAAAKKSAKTTKKK